MHLCTYITYTIRRTMDYVKKKHNIPTMLKRIKPLIYFM